MSIRGITRLMLAALLLALVTGRPPSVASAADPVQPILVEEASNIPCNDLVQYIGNQFNPWPFGTFNEFKRNHDDSGGLLGSNNGVYNIPGWGTITLEIVQSDSNGQPTVVNWSSTFGIDIVIVKAQAQNVYVYTPEGFGQDGLSTPGNKGISHITFCWDNQATSTTDLKVVKQNTSGAKLAGWSFDLKLGGVTIAGGVTDSNGELTFHNLSYNTYQVCETPRDGLVPADGQLCKSVTLNQTSGALVTVTFTNRPAVVTPHVECVVKHTENSYTAYFGYESNEAIVVNVPLGADNGFSPTPGDRGQPTSFEPGRTPPWPELAFSDEAFGVQFDGSALTWTLLGNSATATKDSPPCAFHVFFEKNWLPYGATGPGDVPTLPDGFKITATSLLGSATCTYSNGVFGCVYSNNPPATDNNGLWVPPGGVYTISEVNAPSGWTVAPDEDNDYTFLVLGDPADHIADNEVEHLDCFYNPQAGELDPSGEVEYCRHTLINNGAPATLVITKVTDPGEGVGKVFRFTVQRGATTVVQNMPITRTAAANGDSVTLNNLPSGTYSVAEVGLPNGWGLAGISCTNSQTSESPTAIGLAAGETVTCVFDNDPLPSLTVTKAAQPASLPEPGGLFTYDVVVTNSSEEEITLTSLTDDQFGDLNGQGSCSVPQILPPNGGSYSCSFQGRVTGNAGLQHTNTVTAAGVDDEQTPASAGDSATVSLTDARPTIRVEKSPSAPQTQPGGGNIIFTVSVTNLSMEPVRVVSLNDTVFGNLDGQGACNVGEADGPLLQPNEAYTCTFTALITADHTNTVTAIAKDDEGNSASDSDDAVVGVPASPLKSALGNFVWHDLNGNGLQDTGEPGVPGVTVNLLNSSDVVIRTTTTGGSGLYLFSNLDPGSYKVEFIKPEAATGFTTPGQPNPAANSDAGQANGRTDTITLPEGVTDDTWDAGLLCSSGIIAGTLDAGAFSGNIPILLLPQNNGNAESLFLATQPDGSFKFPTVAPGSYLVQVHDTFLAAHGLTPAAGSSSLAEVTVLPCRSVEISFVYNAGAGALGDLVWYDVNGNGSQDEWRDADNNGSVTKNPSAQAAPLPLDQLEWYDINGDGNFTGPENEGELNRCGLHVPATSLLALFSNANLDAAVTGQGTGVTGYYRFHALALGEPGWTVKLDGQNPALIDAALAMFNSGRCKPLAAGTASAADSGSPSRNVGQDVGQDAGAAAVTVCAVTTPASDDTVLTGEQPVYLDADFGIRCTTRPELTALGDRVWADANRNGLQDPGEAGVANVTVNLYRVGTAAPISTTVTDAAGFYWFDNLSLGDYFVEFVTPTGFILTQANVQNNGQDALDSDGVAPVVNLSVSDGGIKATLGKPLTYTLTYENVDQLNPAGGVVLHTTVPVGAVANLATSTPGWSCAATPAAGGVACSLTVGNVAAGASGSVRFIVMIGDDDKSVPTTIELQASLTHTTPGRTHVATPPAESADPTLDAGLTTGELRQQTGTATVRNPGSIPTSLDGQDQPGRGRRLFIPAAMQ